ncbi:MAG: hypothetical protein HRT47_02180 [Candidatus Caenarcaniphilales bacterium]|nr:hypothetical protein [Candidatus Caenarcaniphilales bacterium]
MANGADSFGKVGSQVASNHFVDQSIKLNKANDNFFGTVISDGAGITGGASVERPVTAPGDNTADLGGDNNSQQHSRSGADQIRHQAYLQQNGTKARIAPPSPKMIEKQNKGDQVGGVVFQARGHDGDTRGLFNSFGTGTRG